jgi:hypothetical protein
MKLGDRIRIFGGYNDEDVLRTVGELRGRVISFIPGYEPNTLAAVVRLDSVVTCSGVTGAILVMELRYQGASWDDGAEPGSQTVGLDLYAEVPETSMAGKLPATNWTALESHAVFEVI